MPPEVLIPLIANNISQNTAAQTAKGAAAGQTEIMDIMRQLLNKYMAQGQEFDPMMSDLAKQAIASLTPGSAAYQARLGGALEGVDTSARSALENLIGQGGPELAARLPQIARALAEQSVQSRAGIYRDFAGQQATDLEKALGIATGMSGRSLLPGSLSALAGMAGQYGAAAGGAPDPTSQFGDIFKQLWPYLNPTSSTVSGVTAPWETRETWDRSQP